MNIPEQIAKHLRDVHFGGNWTAVNMKDTLDGVDWQMATHKIEGLNTIAALVFHIHYYVETILKVYKGGPLDAHDKYSFDLPPVQSEEDWNKLVQTALYDAEELAMLLRKFPENRLGHNFADEKYGTYFRNYCGLIEHTHYHLGQIVLIKKLLKK